jgi:hypothetical protein
MNNLKTELQAAQTNPVIMEQLILGLNLWRKGETQDTYDLVAQQTQIGWNTALEGCIGQIWQDTQEYHIQMEQVQQRSQKWANMVVRKLWRITWDMWQHCNLKEHKDDKEKESSQIASVILNEIETGTQNIKELDIFFTEAELAKVQGRVPKGTKMHGYVTLGQGESGQRDKKVLGRCN